MRMGATFVVISSGPVLSLSDFWSSGAGAVIVTARQNSPDPAPAVTFDQKTELPSTSDSSRARTRAGRAVYGAPGQSRAASTRALALRWAAA